MWERGDQSDQFPGCYLFHLVFPQKYHLKHVKSEYHITKPDERLRKQDKSIKKNTIPEEGGNLFKKDPYLVVDRKYKFIYLNNGENVIHFLKKWDTFCFLCLTLFKVNSSVLCCAGQLPFCQTWTNTLL